MILSPLRYDSDEGALPRQTASSANNTCGAPRSTSEKTATVFIPSFLTVFIIRRAISPRLATNIFCIIYYVIKTIFRRIIQAPKAVDFYLPFVRLPQGGSSQFLAAVPQ